MILGRQDPIKDERALWPVLEVGKHSPLTLQRFRNFGLAIVAVALVTGACSLLRPYLLPSNLGAFYLLLVCWLAYQVGRGPALLASALGSACFDFFFIAPYNRFAISDQEYIFTFLSLLGVAWIIGSLTARAREQAAAALAGEREAVALLEFSRALSAARGEAAILQLTTERISERLDSPCFCSDQPDMHRTCYALRNSAGEALTWLSGTSLPAPEQAARYRSLETFAHQAALALERERLAVVAQAARLYQAEEKLQTTLLNCISHDLRTPLVAIQGTLESLHSGRDARLNPAERELLLANAIQETDRLNRFTANLMQISRLESGHLQLRLEPQDLGEVLEATLKQLRYPERVKVNLPDDLPLVMADFLLLQQAFWNLLDNALKFAPEGPIHIGAEPGDKTVEVRIRDFGPGVAEEQQGLIFQRFYRGNPDVKGSGLGLPISRGLVEAMRGRLIVEPARPGARFRMVLPSLDLVPTPDPVASN